MPRVAAASAGRSRSRRDRKRKKRLAMEEYRHVRVERAQPAIYRTRRKDIGRGTLSACSSFADDLRVPRASRWMRPRDEGNDDQDGRRRDNYPDVGSGGNGRRSSTCTRRPTSIVLKSSRLHQDNLTRETLSRTPSRTRVKRSGVRHAPNILAGYTTQIHWPNILAKYTGDIQRNMRVPAKRTAR